MVHSEKTEELEARSQKKEGRSRRSEVSGQPTIGTNWIIADWVVLISNFEI
jgi:hypothetical protein